MFNSDKIVDLKERTEELSALILRDGHLLKEVNEKLIEEHNNTGEGFRRSAAAMVECNGNTIALGKLMEEGFRAASEDIEGLLCKAHTLKERVEATDEKCARGFAMVDDEIVELREAHCGHCGAISEIVEGVSVSTDEEGDDGETWDMPSGAVLESLLEYLKLDAKINIGEAGQDATVTIKKRPAPKKKRTAKK